MTKKVMQLNTPNLLASSKITITDDTQDYLSSVANSSLFGFNSNQNTSPLSTSQTYSDYSNPIWFAASNASNTGSYLSATSLAAIAPTATLVGSTGGFRINLVWDSTVSTAPSTFQSGIINAAQLLCNSLSNNIVVNISITCSGTGGGAYAGPSGGTGMSYATVKSDLIKYAAAGDTTFNALPTGTSVQGQTQVVVWNAQLKLWGLATSGTNDGNATFAKDINSNLLPGVALHELTHVLGRIPYGPTPDVFDLFRYTSQGNLLFTYNAPSAASYFSLDGGKTKIADYGINSDPSDFLNSGVQGSIDPFDEFYNGSTTQTLTAVDLKQLDALGFTIKSTTPTPTPVPSTGSIATFISNLASLGASSFTITDTSANVALNIDVLQTNVAKITSITQSATATATATALAITATQLTADATALNKISGSYTLTVSGVTGATVATTTANTHVSSMTVTDTGANIVTNLAALQTNVAKITSITQSNIGTALAITAAQFTADATALNKISGSYTLTVSGVTGSTVATTTANTHVSSMTVIDTGANIVTNLDTLQTNIAKITSITVSNIGTALAITAAQYSADNAVLSKISGAINLTVTGTAKNDIINGNTTGGLTINGGGGTDTIVLGTHTNADTIYLVANVTETITGFGSSTGSIVDLLNVTATGNALAGLTLQNKTTLATNNSALAKNSTGLVFSHADAGVALTEASVAALFSNTQATNKFAIATGTGIELLIETGASSTSNTVWEIIDTAGVFTAIKLTGITVVAGHNITFANFH